ncbi:BfmA/BtgA family mobilization protein [Spirosoma panaciterrae]|uniref:BfmA/BtgA family mobilization protein n=1 Tax=Spirosoma panaciterrae TaxID=496058 RepID=UPI0012FA7E94|nr:BfmA/BtgA family mobilization protein [Spirosoma panaciterrae]
MANRVVAIDETVHDVMIEEVEQLNANANREYQDQYKLADTTRRRKLKKPEKLTLKSYTESALEYFRKNHIDPRSLGEEKDVVAEVKKLRNNVFSFMQVQERTYLMPFVQDVYELRNRTEGLEETSVDMLNLMEIFIDLLLAGLGLSEQEQDKYKARAAQAFAQKKASRKQNVG